MHWLPIEFQKIKVGIGNGIGNLINSGKIRVGKLLTVIIFNSELQPEVWPRTPTITSEVGIGNP